MTADGTGELYDMGCQGEGGHFTQVDPNQVRTAVGVVVTGGAPAGVAEVRIEREDPADTASAEKVIVDPAVAQGWWAVQLPEGATYAQVTFWRDTKHTAELVARTEDGLLKLEHRPPDGRLKDPAKIGRAAQRILSASGVARLFEVDIGEAEQSRLTLQPPASPGPCPRSTRSPDTGMCACTWLD